MQIRLERVLAIIGDELTLILVARQRSPDCADWVSRHQALAFLDKRTYAFVSIEYNNCSNGHQMHNYTAITALNMGAPAGAPGFHKFERRPCSKVPGNTQVFFARLAAHLIEVRTESIHAFQGRWPFLDGCIG